MKGSKRLTVPVSAAALSLSLGSLWAGSALGQSTNVCGLPTQASIHALTTDNVIFSFSQGVARAARVGGIDGNLIGIDFRVSDGPTGKLYGLTDSGKLYRISIDPQNPQPAALVSTLTPRYAGGFQSLADFNPVLAPNANALRLIASNDQNFAVVDSGGTLNSTAVQTAVSYVQGDVNFGVDPNLTAGAYDNNAAGATFTTFYAIDYDLDTFVTIADRNASGSSNTGGGKLKTIGPLVDPQGRPINFAPNAGMDVFTQFGGNSGLPTINQAVAISGQTLYCISLNTFDPSLPPGTQQKVVAVPVTGPVQPSPVDPTIVTGGLIDVAVNPFAAPAPASADLSIEVLDSPDPVRVGSALTYKVTVSNAGPSAAGDVSLSASQSAPTINLPPTLTLISAVPSQGSCAATGAGPFNIKCSFGTIQAGAAVSIVVNVQVTNPSRSVVPSVSSLFLALSSTVSDPNNNNNSLIATTSVQF